MSTALEVDFTSFYGEDFRDAMWGSPGIRWEPRRLICHVEALMHRRESAYRRLMQGGGLDEEVPRLLVALLAEVKALRYEQAMLMGSKPEEPELPELGPLKNRGLAAEWEDAENGTDEPEIEQDDGGSHFASAKEIMQFLGGIGRPGQMIDKQG